MKCGRKEWENEIQADKPDKESAGNDVSRAFKTIYTTPLFAGRVCAAGVRGDSGCRQQLVQALDL